MGVVIEMAAPLRAANQALGTASEVLGAADEALRPALKPASEVLGVADEALGPALRPGSEVPAKAVKKLAGLGRKGMGRRGMGRVKKLQWKVSKKAIKDWAPEERPRERLLRLGAEHLSQAELLAILLRDGGGPGQSAVELARQVLYRHGPWEELNPTPGQLMNIPGLGEAKATVILAALELSRRKRDEVLPERHFIHNSRESVDYARRWLGNIIHEGFAVMYLAQAGWVKSFEINSKGGISSTTVDIRLILARALELRAVSLIVFHNHPSGSLWPSKSDEQLTQKLSQAARTMDIKLLDHVIIGKSGHFSFADEGMLS